MPTGPPELVPVRLEAAAAAGKPGYVINVDARGRGSLSLKGAPPVRRTLPDDAQDTLRLLLARLMAAPAVDCADPGRRRAIIGGRDPVTVIECRSYGVQPEFRAATALLERQFEIRGR